LDLSKDAPETPDDGIEADFTQRPLEDILALLPSNEDFQQLADQGRVFSILLTMEMTAGKFAGLKFEKLLAATNFNPEGAEVKSAIKEVFDGQVGNVVRKDLWAAAAPQEYFYTLIGPNEMGYAPAIGEVKVTPVTLSSPAIRA